jgi:two-component system, chemotaxis family, chemotaxis protein CheY
MKILITDDSETMRRILVNTLTQMGFTEILQAENGAKAIEQAQKHRDGLKLIMMDWNMPVMNGLDCLKKLKENPLTNPIPVLMATSESDRTQVIKAIQSGASNYIIKPFKPRDLEEKIRTLLKLKKPE